MLLSSFGRLEMNFHLPCFPLLWLLAKIADSDDDSFVRLVVVGVVVVLSYVVLCNRRSHTAPKRNVSPVPLVLLRQQQRNMIELQ